MKRELTVVMGGQIAGRLNDADGNLSFEYERDYQEAGGTPLSVSMPLVRDSFGSEVVKPWLQGLLPDNDAVLEAWGRRFHVSANSPFQLLSTPIGHDCPGAVRFAKADEVGDLISGKGSVEWLSEADVGERLSSLRREPTSWLGQDFTGQFSLAGSQSKTALLFEDGRWGVPSGARATTHILKPAIEGLADQDVNEHLCLEAARILGMAAARTRIVQFGEEAAIVVDRYDRQLRGGKVVRVHQEDLCQAMGLSPSVKYQNMGGPTPPDIVTLLRNNASSAMAGDAQAHSFVEALVWNWLIAGTDAHAKNYSLLLSGGDVVLAPLYDIASGLPYFDIHKMKLAMKLGGFYEMEPYGNPFAKAAAELGVDEVWFAKRSRELAGGAAEAMAKAAEAESVKSLSRKLPERLVEAVAKRAVGAVEYLDHIT